MCFHVSQMKKATQLENRFDAEFEYPELYEPYYHLIVGKRNHYVS